MELFARAARIPGDRIAGYRNSRPRRIRLLGLGDEGSRIAHEIARQAYPNVEVGMDAGPIGLKEIIGGPQDEGLDMVIIVCREGDERLFRPPPAKPNMLVTFVVVQEIAQAAEVQETLAAQIRGLSDLFVTTSDPDYVGDLIANLAS
jgi:hypothetical protein